MRRKNLKHKASHHRKCKSNGGSSSRWNMSVVSKKKHQSWHILFRNYRPDKIAKIINKVWIDPDWMFVLVLRTDVQSLTSD